jgi:hypothetical protein
MRAAALGFSEHLFAYQQSQFDANSGKPDALAAYFRAGSDVMILPHRLPLHAGPVVYDGQRGLCSISGHRDSAGP